jgi:Lar family restriction alleviation protein
MAELKPCPFCGGKVEIKELRWGHQFFEIYCPKCDFGMAREYSRDLHTAWNRRAEDGK